MPSPLSGSFFSMFRRSNLAHVSLVTCAVLCTTLPIAAKSTHYSAKHKLRKSSHSSLRHASTPAMAAERATQIQTALIQKGYLAGEPSGNWDAQTISAMQKLQSDNGWQSKVTPDARALIKLGLGPAPIAPLTTAPSPQR